MNQLAAALTLIAGIVIGGAIADALGDFLMLFSGGVTVGGVLGAAYGLARRRGHRRDEADPIRWGAREPADWQRYGSIGGLAGGAAGLLLAIVDALLGG